LAKCDVFALGVILINFLTGEYPFPSVFNKDNSIDLSYEAFLTDPSLFLKEYSEDKDLIDLISGMLRFKEDDRFSIQDVLAHKWTNL
jgi:serine/threonine protein kinase